MEKDRKFRLGNEMRKGRYWEEKGKRECRMCGGEEEMWEHIWEDCRKWKGEGKELAGSV